METAGKDKNVFGADIYATPAIGAIRREYNGARPGRSPLEWGFQDQWLGANGVAVGTVIAVGSFFCGYAQYAFEADQAVGSTYRANASTPTAVHDEQVKEENRQYDGPGQPAAKQQAAVQHGHGIYPLPCNGACNRADDQCHSQNPVARSARQMRTSADTQEWAQPGGKVGDRVDRANP